MCYTKLNAIVLLLLLLLLFIVRLFLVRNRYICIIGLHTLTQARSLSSWKLLSTFMSVYLPHSLCPSPSLFLCFALACFYAAAAVALLCFEFGAKRQRRLRVSKVALRILAVPTSLSLYNSLSRSPSACCVYLHIVYLSLEFADFSRICLLSSDL